MQFDFFYVLLPFYQDKLTEAGCDEAGRGCLAGPVVAAAVILPKTFSHPLLNDSKQISESNRYKLRELIEQEAIAYAVAMVDHEEIDHINILKASIKAMHLALDALKRKPKYIIVDGNRFYAYKNIPHTTIVKGDGKYASIAAASILAKTYRDDYMLQLHGQFPDYNWLQNKGYPTAFHRSKIHEIGLSPFHRKSFAVKVEQASLF